MKTKGFAAALFAVAFLRATSPAAAGTVLRLALGAPSADRAAAEPADKSAVQPFVSLGLGVTSIKSSAAARIQTGGSGFTFGLGAGLTFFNVFDLGVGADLIWLRDDNPFTNSTTGGDRSSSVWPLTYYAQAGLCVPVPIRNESGHFPVWVACYGGVFGVSVERSIAECIDCDVEKLSLAGGHYLRPEIRLRLEERVFLCLGYTIYCACSDFKNAVTLSFSGNFGALF